MGQRTNEDTWTSVFFGCCSTSVRVLTPTVVDPQDAIEKVMDELVDEVTLGLCFEVHRSVKKGTFFLDDTEKE